MITSSSFKQLVIAFVCACVYLRPAISRSTHVEWLISSDPFTDHCRGELRLLSIDSFTCTMQLQRRLCCSQACRSQANIASGRSLQLDKKLSRAIDTFNTYHKIQNIGLSQLELLLCPPNALAIRKSYAPLQITENMSYTVSTDRQNYLKCAYAHVYVYEENDELRTPFVAAISIGHFV